MKKISISDKRNQLRKNRVKAKITQGDIKHPRLSVFRSNRHISLQIIDDIKRTTIVSAKNSEIKGKDKKRLEIAFELGKLIAGKAIEKKLKKVVFDRNRYLYHGVVKAVADGAREGGLII